MVKPILGDSVELDTHRLRRYGKQPSLFSWLDILMLMWLTVLWGTLLQAYQESPFRTSLEIITVLGTLGAGLLILGKACYYSYRWWQDCYVFDISIRNGFGPYEQIIGSKRKGITLPLGQSDIYVLCGSVI